jgi:hypothetical protein
MFIRIFRAVLARNDYFQKILLLFQKKYLSGATAHDTKRIVVL